MGEIIYKTLVRFAAVLIILWFSKDLFGEPGGIGDGDRVVLVGERDHREHRPEDLVLGERARRVDVGEDGRGHEEPGGERPVEPPPARHQTARAGRAGPVDHSEDPLTRRLRDDRAHEGPGIEWIPDRGEFDHRHESFEHGVVDVAMHEESGGQGASLSGQRREAERRHGDGPVEIGVGEHQVRRLPAEFEGQRGECLRRRLHHPGRRRPAPGEADLGDVGVPHQGVAGLGPAGDHVEDTGRQAGFERQLGETVRAERRQLGRLGDDRVAGGQRGCRLLPHAHHRAVPRWDHADDAVRLAKRVVQAPPGVGGHHPTLDLVDPPGVVPDPAGGVTAGIEDRHRHACLHGPQPAALLGLGVEQVGQPEQDRRPAVSRESRHAGSAARAAATASPMSDAEPSATLAWATPVAGR